MKKIRLAALLIALVLIAGMQIFLSEANAQSGKCEWTIKNIRSEFVKKIGDSRSTMTVKTGKILEVTGDFFCSNCKPYSIDTTKIKLEGTKKEGKASVKWSESIAGVGILNSYIFPQVIVKGSITNTVGLKDSKEKSEFTIGKEKEGAPAVLTIAKSPSTLNLAFTIPDNTDSEFKLTFDNNAAKFKVK